MMPLKLLFLHTLPNSWKLVKTMVKIIQKANNEICQINAFLDHFLWLLLIFFKITPYKTK